MPHALTMHRKTKKTCRLCVVVQSWDGRWVGCFVNLRQKKGTLFDIENFPKTFLQAEQKKPKGNGQKNAKIKSPPNLCLLANFVTSPLEIHTVAAPPPPKNIMQHPLGFRRTCSSPIPFQERASQWQRVWGALHFWGCEEGDEKIMICGCDSWYAWFSRWLPRNQKRHVPVPILLIVQNSGSPVELDSLSHYLRFFGSTSRWKKSRISESTTVPFFVKVGWMKSSFLKAVWGEGCLESPKNLSTARLFSCWLGHGIPRLGAGGSPPVPSWL